jgi:tetratricopeptide (TPR) repeat protein
MRIFSKHIFTVVYSVFFTACVYAQSPVIDSLKKVIALGKSDTDHVKAVNMLSWELKFINPDTSEIIANRVLGILRTNKTFPASFRDYMEARTYNQLGVFNNIKGDPVKGIRYYLTSYDLFKKILIAGGKNTPTRIKAGVSTVLGNIGIYYYHEGDYAKALDYFLKALTIDEELKNDNGIVRHLNNVGNVYKDLGDLTKALDYYNQSKIKAQQGNNTAAVADAIINCGLVYNSLRDFEKAEACCLQTMEIRKKLGNPMGVGFCYGALALIYDSKGEYEKAIDSYKKALIINTQVNNLNYVCLDNTNIGETYVKLKKYTEAETYLLKALPLSKDLGALVYQSKIEQNLSSAYEMMGKPEKALIHYKAHIVARDSIFNEENTKKLVRSEMNFDFEKKEATAKLEQEKKEAVTAAESKKQRIILWSVSGILLLVFTFAVFAYRSYLQKQKANIEITKQKEIIEEKQKEILDSIHYAKRIQTALLPSEKYFEKNLAKRKG